MRVLISTRQEEILVALTILFIVGVIGYYIQGVHDIANTIQESISVSANTSDIVHYNLEDAQKINFKKSAQ